MKTPALLTLCILALATARSVQGEISDETKTMAAQNKECVDQTGISLDMLEKLSVNPTDDMPKSSMCFIKCVAELEGLEKDGVLQNDAAVSKRPEGLSKENAEKIIDECGKLATDDPCETSFKRYLCIFEKSEKKIWLKPE